MRQSGCSCFRWSVCAAVLAAAPVPAPSVLAGEGIGLGLHIDNDALSSREDDKDYTGGLSLVVTGPGAADHPLSLDAALSFIDTTTGLESAADAPVLQGFEAGMTVFTPEDIETADPLTGDRPYASLVFISNTRNRPQPEAGRSVVTTLTLGVLGTKLPGELQGTFHGVTHSKEARGWNNQVSHGGEATFRYRVAFQRVLRSHIMPAGAAFDVIGSVQASLGYITELAWSISARRGKIRSPWWLFNPQLGLYGEKSASGIYRRPGDGDDELYWLGGITLHARAYNAFLQGQFRDNPVEIASDALNPIVGEAWIGVTSAVHGGFRVSYTLRGQTSELEDGGADRSPVWGGVVLSRSF